MRSSDTQDLNFEFGVQVGPGAKRPFGSKGGFAVTGGLIDLGVLQTIQLLNPFRTNTVVPERMRDRPEPPCDHGE